MEPLRPLNKRLWTSSFVLWTGGISLVTLSILIWLVDLRNKASRLVYPAIVFGTNALAAYVFSELLASLLGTLRLPGFDDLLTTLALSTTRRGHPEPQRRRAGLRHSVCRRLLSSGPDFVPQTSLPEGVSHLLRRQVESLKNRQPALSSPKTT